jgi:exosortase
VYACTYPFLSPLLRGTAAFIALSCLLGAWRFGRALHPGLLGLMLLALPIIPPLQFYIGYPLRLLTAFVSSRLLALNGLAVDAVGTCLDWNGTLVAVDAPCSGVRMLWTGLYLAMMLACFLRLSTLRTIAFTCVAVAVVIAGNVLRTSTLFYIESDILAAPAWAHEGVGGAAFLIVAAAIAGTAHYMQRRNVCSAV